MRGQYRRIPVPDEESEEESDPRQTLPIRQPRKSPDKGRELLERVDLRRSTRRMTQNRDDEFEYPPTQKNPRKTTSNITQGTGSLGVNEQQGPQISARNKGREEPGTITTKSAKTVKNNLGKSNVSGGTFTQREREMGTEMGTTKTTDRVRLNRASKESEKATKLQKQLVTKIKGGSKNKPVKMPAKPGGPPSSPSSSSSDDDSSSRSRSRGGYDDSDNSEDEEEEPEDNDSDDARSSGDESPPEDPSDGPPDPDEPEEPSDSESEDSRDDEADANITMKTKEAAARESIQILSTILDTVDKYSKSRDKKKTLRAASCLDNLKIVGEKILRDELTLSASEKSFLSGTNVPWTSRYRRHLLKCEKMSTMLIKLIDLLELVGTFQAATHSINTSVDASEHNVGCNAHALLPIAGVVFNQLHKLLTREGVHDDEWETSNSVWLKQLPMLTERAAKASSRPGDESSKRRSEKGFTNWKGMETLRKDLKRLLQDTLKQVHGDVISCAVFAITAQTLIGDNDHRVRNLIVVPQGRYKGNPTYEDYRIEIAREALMSLDPNDCDTDMRSIIEHMQQRGKERPLNGEPEPPGFESWIKWVTKQASEVTLRNAITIAMKAIYSAPALGDSVHHAKANFDVHLRTIENSIRRLYLHPFSRTHAMKKILYEDSKAIVLANYVHMAEAILTSIAKQYNKSEAHLVLSNWLSNFQNGIQDEARVARLAVERLRGGNNTEKNSKSTRFAKFYTALENENYEALDYTEGLISDVIGPAIWKVIKQFVETYSKMQRRKTTDATVHHVAGQFRDTHLGEEERVPVKEEQEAAVMTLGAVDSDPEMDWDSLALEHFVQNVGIETRGNACFGCNQEGHAFKECPKFSNKLNQLKESANELVKNASAEGAAFSALITDLKSSNNAYKAFISKFRSSYQKKPPQYFTRRQ